jgi:hypothetical protein
MPWSIFAETLLVSMAGSNPNTLTNASASSPPAGDLDAGARPGGSTATAIQTVGEGFLKPRKKGFSGRVATPAADFCISKLAMHSYLCLLA